MSDSLEPKLTVKELKELRTVIFTGADGREYQSDLPGSWSNAKVAATDVEKVCHECRDSPHFDTEAYNTNRELARRVQEAFEELKPGKGFVLESFLDAPGQLAVQEAFEELKPGKGFVLAWRLYAEKDHPRWKVADGCGCGCGCHSAQEPKPSPTAAKSKSTRKGGKPTPGGK